MNYQSTIGSGFVFKSNNIDEIIECLKKNDSNHVIIPRDELYVFMSYNALIELIKKILIDIGEKISQTKSEGEE